MHPIRGLAAVATLAALAAGCGTYATHVDTEDAALGRVVVYRNGIAYYERHATVTDGRLRLTVPQDKVDDFLKSLTIADRATNKPLPMSYDTSGAAHDGKVEMVIQVDDPAVTDVVLTYITESPAWKPSYRVVVDEEADRIELQGWAIVDNTSGERWEKVRVGVGASSALSFRYDLRSVRNISRPILGTEQRFAVAPPTGGSTHGSGHRAQVVVAQLDGHAIPTTDGDYARRETAASGGDDIDYADAPTVVQTSRVSPTRGARARDAAPSPAEKKAEHERAAKVAAEAQARAQQEAYVQQLAGQLKGNRAAIVVESWAYAGEPDGETRAADRGNWLRNRLVEEGVAPARVTVAANAYDPSTPAGVRIVQVDAPGGADPAMGDGQPIGESHFQSTTPITVDKGTSAMVAILDDKTKGRISYLYDAESERGNARFAFKAVRFENPTDSTLETGPITFYGDGRFIGEGLTEPIPPRATAVIPYALDRQIVVERTGDTRDRISQLLTLSRGVLRTEVQHQRRLELTFTSLLHKPTEVFVRHTVRQGWTLVESPDLYEKLDEAHLFRVQLAAGETKRVVISEETPLTKAIDLRAPEGIELVRAYLSGDVEARIAEPMRRLLALHTEMVDTREAIVSARERTAEFRTRLEELQTQIVSLQDVRGGRDLMRHLQSKLKEVSDRVQAGTIEVVDLQQKLMVARVRFQDAIAELSLEAAARSPRNAGTDASPQG